MKNNALIVALVGLAGLGAIAAAIIIDPVGASGLVGMAPRKEARAAVSAPAQESQARQVAAAGEQEPASRPPSRRGSTETSGGASRSDENFDRKATSEEESGPPSRRRPPKRGEESEESTEQQESQVRVGRIARYVGEQDLPDTERQPRAEMYPLITADRRFPDPSSITVTLAVTNASGDHWKTAYVAIRSSRYPGTQVFEIGDWGIDERVGLEYTFPKAEVNDRLRDLRVVRVTGEKRQSALADLLARNRLQYFEALYPAQDFAYSDRAGDRLSAPGLLGMIGSLQSSVTGIRTEIIQPRIVKLRPLQITIPEEMKLGAPPVFLLSQSTEDRRVAKELLGQFHSRGIAVEEALVKFTEAMGEGLAEEALAGPAAAPLQEVRTRQQAFNAAGRDLAAVVQRSNDAELREILSLIRSTSQKLLRQIQYVEGEIQMAKTGFKI